ncbi:Olfactory receptor 6B1 [Camelus dromedarius]|uniref:Olfactory receptor 6B1 n=1 Tax=Camelus dromedarius TaxID=9838 RepID=A0A5N4DKH7_CAMDR|nr:Olfactory receptor 6B1 [Camelus dromedarius]
MGKGPEGGASGKAPERSPAMTHSLHGPQTPTQCSESHRARPLMSPIKSHLVPTQRDPVRAVLPPDLHSRPAETRRCTSAREGVGRLAVTWSKARPGVDYVDSHLPGAPTIKLHGTTAGHGSGALIPLVQAGPRTRFCRPFTGPGSSATLPSALTLPGMGTVLSLLCIQLSRSPSRGAQLGSLPGGESSRLFEVSRSSHPFSCCAGRVNCRKNWRGSPKNYTFPQESLSASSTPEGAGGPKAPCPPAVNPAWLCPSLRLLATCPSSDTQLLGVLAPNPKPPPLRGLSDASSTPQRPLAGSTWYDKDGRNPPTLAPQTLGTCWPESSMEEQRLEPAWMRNRTRHTRQIGSSLLLCAHTTYVKEEAYLHILARCELVPRCVDQRWGGIRGDRAPLSSHDPAPAQEAEGWPSKQHLHLSLGGSEQLLRTLVARVHLLSFPELCHLQALLFGSFLTIYVVTVLENLVIVVTVGANHQLHTTHVTSSWQPSVLETLSPQSPSPSCWPPLAWGGPSPSGCLTQLFLSSPWALRVLLLATMAVTGTGHLLPAALCGHHGLEACLRALSAWLGGFLASFVSTALISALRFCGPNVLNHFLCDISPPAVSCSDTTTIEVLDFIAALAVLATSLLVTMVSYACILATVLRIQEGRLPEAFPPVLLTWWCGHLLHHHHFMYARPVPSAPLTSTSWLSVVYRCVPPLLNPIIYCLRNRDIREPWPNSTGSPEHQQQENFKSLLCHLLTNTSHTRQAMTSHPRARPAPLLPSPGTGAQWQRLKLQRFCLLSRERLISSSREVPLHSLPCPLRTGQSLWRSPSAWPSWAHGPTPAPTGSQLLGVDPAATLSLPVDSGGTCHFPQKQESGGTLHDLPRPLSLALGGRSRVIQHGPSSDCPDLTVATHPKPSPFPRHSALVLSGLREEDSCFCQQMRCVPGGSSRLERALHLQLRFAGCSLLLLRGCVLDLLWGPLHLPAACSARPSLALGCIWPARTGLPRGRRGILVSVWWGRLLRSSFLELLLFGLYSPRGLQAPLGSDIACLGRRSKNRRRGHFHTRKPSSPSSGGQESETSFLSPWLLMDCLPLCSHWSSLRAVCVLIFCLQGTVKVGRTPPWWVQDRDQDPGRSPHLPPAMSRVSSTLQAPDGSHKPQHQVQVSQRKGGERGRPCLAPLVGQSPQAPSGPLQMQAVGAALRLLQCPTTPRARPDSTVTMEVVRTTGPELAVTASGCSAGCAVASCLTLLPFSSVNVIQTSGPHTGPSSRLPSFFPCVCRALQNEGAGISIMGRPSKYSEKDLVQIRSLLSALALPDPWSRVHLPSSLISSSSARSLGGEKPLTSHPSQGQGGSHSQKHGGHTVDSLSRTGERMPRGKRVLSTAAPLRPASWGILEAPGLPQLLPAILCHSSGALRRGALTAPLFQRLPPGPEEPTPSPTLTPGRCQLALGYSRGDWWEDAAGPGVTMPSRACRVATQSLEDHEALKEAERDGMMRSLCPLLTHQEGLVSPVSTDGKGRGSRGQTNLGKQTAPFRLIPECSPAGTGKARWLEHGHFRAGGGAPPFPNLEGACCSGLGQPAALESRSPLSGHHHPELRVDRAFCGPVSGTHPPGKGGECGKVGGGRMRGGHGAQPDGVRQTAWYRGGGGVVGGDRMGALGSERGCTSEKPAFISSLHVSQGMSLRGGGLTQNPGSAARRSSPLQPPPPRHRSPWSGHGPRFRPRPVAGKAGSRFRARTGRLGLAPRGPGRRRREGTGGAGGGGSSRCPDGCAGSLPFQPSGPDRRSEEGWSARQGGDRRGPNLGPELRERGPHSVNSREARILALARPDSGPAGPKGPRESRAEAHRWSLPQTPIWRQPHPSVASGPAGSLEYEAPPQTEPSPHRRLLTTLQAQKPPTPNPPALTPPPAAPSSPERVVLQDAEPPAPSLEPLKLRSLLSVFGRFYPTKRTGRPPRAGLCCWPRLPLRQRRGKGGRGGARGSAGEGCAGARRGPRVPVRPAPRYGGPPWRVLGGGGRAGGRGGGRPGRGFQLEGGGALGAGPGGRRGRGTRRQRNEPGCLQLPGVVDFGRGAHARRTPLPAAGRCPGRPGAAEDLDTAGLGARSAPSLRPPQRRRGPPQRPPSAKRPFPPLPTASESRGAAWAVRASPARSCSLSYWDPEAASCSLSCPSASPASPPTKGSLGPSALGCPAYHLEVLPSQKGGCLSVPIPSRPAAHHSAEPAKEKCQGQAVQATPGPLIPPWTQKVALPATALGHRGLLPEAVSVDQGLGDLGERFPSQGLCGFPSPGMTMQFSGWLPGHTRSREWPGDRALPWADALRHTARAHLEPLCSDLKQVT